MKRLVITGGAGGIGRCTVELFLERGWSVVFSDIDSDSGSEFESDLHKRGYENAWFYKCDVTSDNSVKSLYEFTMEKMSGVDCVVNNAGIVLRCNAFHLASEDTLMRSFEVNVKSILLTSRYFVPYMIENGGGSIVNTASITGRYGDPGNSCYGASKGAIVNLARCMAIDYAKYNIRVNNVNPAATATSMFLDDCAIHPEILESVQHCNPMGRIALPEEIAHGIYFLASNEESSFITGFNLDIAGGAEIQTGHSSGSID